MDNLESRIRALEASNRRQRYSITALAAIIVGGALIAATRPGGDATFDTVTCKKWTLVDEDGKVRIRAITSADGDAAMSWSDKNGKERIVSGITADGNAATTWLDKDQKSRITAGTLADGDAFTHWMDKDGKPRYRSCRTPEKHSRPCGV
jgi:hypothetical protein